MIEQTLAQERQKQHENTTSYSLDNIYSKNKTDGLLSVIRAFEQLLGKEDHNYRFSTCLAVINSVNNDYRYPMDFEIWSEDDNLEVWLDQCYKLLADDEWRNNDKLYGV